MSRIQYPEAANHVTNRGDQCEDIFCDDEDRHKRGVQPWRDGNQSNGEIHPGKVLTYDYLLVSEARPSASLIPPASPSISNMANPDRSQT